MVIELIKTEAANKKTSRERKFAVVLVILPCYTTFAILCSFSYVLY